MLGYDQRPPAELYATGRRELSSYPSVEYRRGQVRRGHRCDSGFDLDVDDGEPIRARRVLLATGMLCCPPEIPELPELWGTSMFRCPFCHGCNAFGLPLTSTVPDRRRRSAFETRIGYTGVVQGAGGLGQARQLATTR